MLPGGCCVESQSDRRIPWTYNQGLVGNGSWHAVQICCPSRMRRAYVYLYRGMLPFWVNVTNKSLYGSPTKNAIIPRSLLLEGQHPNPFLCLSIYTNMITTVWMWTWTWTWRWEMEMEMEMDRNRYCIEIDSIYIWIWTYIYGYRYRYTCTYTDTYTDTDADIVLLSVRRNGVDEQPDSLLQASNSLWSAWSESASLRFSWACCFQISREQLWYHDLLNCFCGSAADVFYLFCVTLGSFGFPGIWTRSRQW